MNPLFRLNTSIPSQAVVSMRFGSTNGIPDKSNAVGTVPKSIPSKVAVAQSGSSLPQIPVKLFLAAGALMALGGQAMNACIGGFQHYVIPAVEHTVWPAIKATFIHWFGF